MSIVASIVGVSAVLASTWPPPQRKYDVVVLGTGLKESLVAGLLASHGKLVLQMGGPSDLESGGASYNLQELAALTQPDGPPLSENKLGKPSEYCIERAPKMFLAGGDQLQLLVGSGAWQHMNPPGFKRVHRSLMYRLRPDGQPDVHRVLANSEDVLKTRSLTAIEKARVVQFFLWIERYDEADPKTATTGPFQKSALNLNKMSAAKFLAHWDLPKQAVAMVVRGMALFEGPPKRLKSKGSALDLVRRLKRYKESYKTFPHMTSPYVRPVGGFSERLTSATANVLEAADGCSVEETGPIELLYEDSACVGVACGGVQVHADCVVASPECVPDHVAPAYHIVRLYAVLAHPPNLCKDSSSCQLLIPAEHCGRSHDIYMSSYSHTHGVAPKGKWVVTASTRIDGSADGADALVIAKRELAAVLPLLKPSRKLLAEVVPYNEPLERVPDRLLVLSSCDETSYFDSVQDDVTSVFERITGEPLAAAGARRAF